MFLYIMFLPKYVSVLRIRNIYLINLFLQYVVNIKSNFKTSWAKTNIMIQNTVFTIVT